ncbi:MAG: HAD family phosphatase [Bryobacteraceae bacterium]
MIQIMSSENTYDAILFDFDGVLADTEPIHCQCWNEILQPFGYHLTWETFARDFVGVSDQDLVRRLAAARVPPIPFDELWAEYPRKKELFRTRVAAAPPIREDTATLIKELSCDYKLAVVSSSARIEIEPAIIARGIRHYFVELVCGKEAQHLKPSPAPYIRAAELLKAERPLVVEDSDAGVTSAQAAGFDFVRIANVGELVSAVRGALQLKGSTEHSGLI